MKAYRFVYLNINLLLKKIFLLILLTNGIYAQSIHHQMLSAQGLSKTLSNGMFISQTIGQQSVIGNYTNGGPTFRQGFQQSAWSKFINKNSSNSIVTITYPNPFISSINFQFSQVIKETISVNLFDVRGRLVFTQSKQANENSLTIELPNLASSTYLVHLSASKYNYYTQILKL